MCYFFAIVYCLKQSSINIYEKLFFIATGNVQMDQSGVITLWYIAVAQRAILNKVVFYLTIN